MHHVFLYCDIAEKKLSKCLIHESPMCLILDNNDDPTGAIIGGTVGGLIFMIVIIIPITIAIRRRFLDQRLTTTHITAIITHSGPQQMQEGKFNI